MIEQWVKAKLDDLGINVYSNKAPEGAGRPYCRFTRISSARTNSMDGDSNLTLARFQVTFYTDNYSALAQLRKDMIPIFSGLRGDWNSIVTIGATFIENEIDSPEPELDLFSGSSDLLVSYKDI